MGNAHHVCNQGVLKVADKACLANPNKTATILTLVGWGNEDQEEVERPGLQSPTPQLLGLCAVPNGVKKGPKLNKLVWKDHQVYHRRALKYVRPPQPAIQAVNQK